MTNIYIFTIRRDRINDSTEYTGLIPKLIEEYTQEEKAFETEIVFNPDIDEQKKYFKKLLDNKNNILHKSNEYIDNEDIEKIINLNLELYPGFDNNYDFQKFNEHLNRAHYTMKYGIYFGLKRANNDEEFKNSINEYFGEGNRRIIYYLKLNELLDYIEKINIRKKFMDYTLLLYLLPGWQYGRIKDDGHVLLEKNIDNTINKEKFIRDVHIFLDNPTIKETDVELICQIPLPKDIFNYTYIERIDLAFKRKYLKYKQKYLKLKKLIN